MWIYSGNKLAKFHGNILSLSENTAKSFRERGYFLTHCTSDQMQNFCRPLLAIIAFACLDCKTSLRVLSYIWRRWRPDDAYIRTYSIHIISSKRYSQLCWRMFIVNQKYTPGSNVYNKTVLFYFYFSFIVVVLTALASSFDELTKLCMTDSLTLDTSQFIVCLSNQKSAENLVLTMIESHILKMRQTVRTSSLRLCTLCTYDKVKDFLISSYWHVVLLGVTTIYDWMKSHACGSKVHLRITKDACTTPTS